MVKATKGTLLTCDPAVKQLILNLNEQQLFIIEDLDDTHLLVDGAAVQKIQEELERLLEENNILARRTVYQSYSSPRERFTPRKFRNSLSVFIKKRGRPEPFQTITQRREETLNITLKEGNNQTFSQVHRQNCGYQLNDLKVITDPRIQSGSFERSPKKMRLEEKEEEANLSAMAVQNNRTAAATESISNRTADLPSGSLSVTNGTSNGNTRLSASSKGKMPMYGRQEADFHPRYGNLPREEVVRLMIQAMAEMGYQEAASKLEQESGYRFESPTITEFRTAVLNGDWPLVENTLDILVPAHAEVDDDESPDGAAATDSSAAVVYTSPEIIAGAKARFLVREQKFLELLEARKMKYALHVLRKELAPIADWLAEQDDVLQKANRQGSSVLSATERKRAPSLSAVDLQGGDVSDATARLHTLSCLLMCHDINELRLRAGWDGAQGTSRHRLLTGLSQFISATFMIPEGRLNTLIEQSREYQAMLCPWHLSHNQFSLYQDHQCPAAIFPTKTIKVLEGHTDEIWHVSWSNNGRFLATCGKDQSAIIWDVATWTIVHRLRDHRHAVTFVAWSPDDAMLLTCCLDKVVRLWDINTGTCMTRLEGHREQVGTAAWLPDGQAVVTGAMDRNVHLWSKDGRIVHTWKTCRVVDLALSDDAKHLVVVGKDGHQGKIHFIHLETDQEKVVVEATDPTCVTLSRDGNAALVSIAPGSLHLYNMEDGTLAHKYTGQQQDKLVIRSCLGGVGFDNGPRLAPNARASLALHSGLGSSGTARRNTSRARLSRENFVLSGSEDNNVYVWHRESSQLIEVLKGHTGPVNSVAWNWSYGFDKAATTFPKSQSLHLNGNGESNKSQRHLNTANVGSSGVFASASDDGSVRIWGFDD